MGMWKLARQVLSGALVGLALTLSASPPASGATTIQLTDDSKYDESPSISGSKVVWYGHTGSYGGVYLWDGGTVTRIGSGQFPVISGSNAAWEDNNEIYFWDGATTTRLTNDDNYDMAPAISGSNVAWMHCDNENDLWCEYGDWEIYVWNGATTRRLTDDDVDDGYPDISGPYVVWVRCDGGGWPLCVGGDTEIYLWDGYFDTRIRLTDNSRDEWYPAIDGSRVVWQGCDAEGSTLGFDCGDGDWEIYLWSGVSPTQITDNSTDETNPDGSGSALVWEMNDGTDLEIYFWKDGIATPITNNDRDDSYPGISGSSVVWQSNYEIYLMLDAPPAPDAVPSISPGGLALLAGLVLGIVAWARRGR